MTSARRTGVACLLAVTGLVAAGCDGENLPELGPRDTAADTGPVETEPPAGTEPVVTEPPATEPPATEPVVTEPAVTEPPVTEAPEVPVPTEPPGDPDAEEADGGLPGWLLPVLLVGGLAVAVAVAASRRRRQDSPAAPDPRRQLISTARWIHDQLSLELLALPPADARQRWVNDRVRFDQLSIDARTSAMTSDPELWNRLASIVDSLASSIDTALRVRAAEGADPELARESVAIANRHRSELDAWIVSAQQLL